ncbi:MAG: threonine synthase [Lachnospiraceae bacterium]|nr:threonine synthase [Lachnospiraceae bacterium]
MEVMYKSTRSDSTPITASQAILKGLADDGGLFVPTSVPHLDKSLRDLAGMNYRAVAYEVMKLMLSDFTEEELKNCISAAYADNFDTPEIVPMRKADGAWYLELFHGPTIAFKDMALQILPHLMTTAARKNKEDKTIVILTATSGDTGKAALAGFAGVEGTRIIVFYPKDGVSSIQERQMLTQEGENTCVIGIRGNFHDAQSGVKKIFTDAAVKELLAENGYQFSSANSINVGRLVPQIVYYVYAYTRLLAAGEIQDGGEVNFVVPTGNFGNILAAWYAKQMGLPVHKLICASNSNKVLYDFFQTGEYDRNREFILTSSPSMDILISSNLERLIWHISGCDSAADAEYMRKLTQDGVYDITPEMRQQLADFAGGFATEEDTAAAIRDLYEKEGYVIDTHTAVAASVYGRYKAESGDLTPAVVASTASPFKFEGSVMQALGKDTDLPDLELADALAAVAGVKVPYAVESLKTAQIRHNIVCGKEEMLAEVEKFLGIEK